MKYPLTHLQASYPPVICPKKKLLADALKAGAAIEEIDILDLEERLAQTDKDDIILVYENLLTGSRNHLQAFTSTLERQTGEVYAPQYLDQETYNTLINADGVTKGGNGQGKMSGNGKGKTNK